jgi:hypothetical protein
MSSQGSETTAPEETKVSRNAVGALYYDVNIIFILFHIVVKSENLPQGVLFIQ